MKENQSHAYTIIAFHILLTVCPFKKGFTCDPKNLVGTLQLSFRDFFSARTAVARLLLFIIILFYYYYQRVGRETKGLYLVSCFRK